MTIIYVVTRDVGRDEEDLELVKAFTDYGKVSSFKDTAELNLTSAQSHIYYAIEEIELVGGNG